MKPVTEQDTDWWLNLQKIEFSHGSYTQPYIHHGESGYLTSNQQMLSITV